MHELSAEHRRHGILAGLSLVRLSHTPRSILSGRFLRWLVPGLLQSEIFHHPDLRTSTRCRVIQDLGSLGLGVTRHTISDMTT